GVVLALVEHRFDGKGHPGLQLHAGARFAIMKHLGLFMKDPADAMAAVVTHNAVVMGFGMLLDHMADITEPGSWFYQFNTFIETLLGHAHQTLGCNTGLAYKIHLAGVAMIAILNDRGVNIQDVAVFQDLLFTGDAVTDHMVDGGANGLGKAFVIERGGDRLLHFRNILMTDAVEFFRGDARFYVLFDHLQHVCGETSGDAHLFDFFRGLYGYIHE